MLALFDPLFAGSALVVEGDNVLGGPRQIGDDESNARIKLARMPFNLGDDAARLRPASGLIGEGRIRPAHVIGRATNRPLEQIADPFLQDAVRGKPDRVFDAFGFEILIDIRIGEARVGAKIDARDLAAIALHDRLQNALPAIGAVDVAGTKRTAFQIAKLIEQEQ